jgi:glycosyltransferase involved in cell wall biosynthesis
VHSVQCQTESAWELLLVDDGSTDRSAVIADELAAADPERIRVLRHDGGVNRGLVASRNLAIAEARGEFLCLLDADDRWEPDKVERQLAALRSRPEVVMMCGPSWHAPEGDRNRATAVAVCRNAPRVLRTAQFARMRMRGKLTTPPPSDPMYRTAAIRQAGGVPEGPMFLEDQRLLVAVSLIGEIFVDDRPLTTYTVRDDSMTGNSRADGMALVGVHQLFERWVVEHCRGRGWRGASVRLSLLIRRLQRGVGRRLRERRL